MQPAVRERLGTRREALNTAARRRPVVIIVDGGDRAEVVLLPPGTVLSDGQDLVCAGATWRVVGWRASARAWIARPRLS